MGIMTAVRSQVPVLQPLPAHLSPNRAASALSGAPVAEPILRTAVRQTERMQETVAPHTALGADHPVAAAREAADAAREAYIRASIAAGISPLPLP